jgi:hypothetical protein
VSRDDDVVGVEIKTLVTFVVDGVFKENTSGGTRHQFVSGCSGERRLTWLDDAQAEHDIALPLQLSLLHVGVPVWLDHDGCHFEQEANAMAVMTR